MKDSFGTKLIFLLLAIVIFSSCKNKVLTLPKDNPLNLALDSLDKELSIILENDLTPGFAVSIVKKDTVIFNKGYGLADIKNQIPFTKHTQHTIASISKTVIAIAIMQLVERNKISLDQEINTLLPFTISNPHFPEIPITIKHLVTHSSSINDDFDDGDKRASWFIEPLPENYNAYHPDIREDIDYFDGQETNLEEYFISFCTPKGKWYHEDNFSNFEPGTQYEYSNSGASLAAFIVEIVSGEPFFEYTKNYIFDPLQMNQTTWYYDIEKGNYSKLYVEKEESINEFPRYHEASYPEGQLKTTASDFSKYQLEILNALLGKGTLLLPESYVYMFNSQLPRTAFDEPSSDKLNDEYDVGVFWGISKPGYILHTGGMMGVYSILYFDPKKETSYFAFCNLAHPDFGNILNALEQFELATNPN